MFRFFNSFIIFLFVLSASLPTFSRCAICYTKGLSGASIALIIIILSFLFLFIANKFLRKILDKKINF